MQSGQQDPKQQIVDKIHQATNILVTVENNPSVDELAAALALTLVLNKMDKHGTAVFSGTIPPAMSFLEPNKTFENTVDSLRDFIIALDKEKADRLRYKVENDVVKIFITPYRSVITAKDLQFSEGDFNVELIIALGVEKREDLDGAIAAHGRILHDATVVTINARDQHSTLGSIDWEDKAASSICEMLAELYEGLKVPNLLDQQIATALLTGVVAATERFSNQLTTSRVMNIAAQLMAAGANQQLIATNLQKKAVPPPVPENTSQKIDKEGQTAEDVAAGEMKVQHEDEKGEPSVPNLLAVPSELHTEKKDEDETFENLLNNSGNIQTSTDHAQDLSKALEEAATKPSEAFSTSSAASTKLAAAETPLLDEPAKDEELPNVSPSHTELHDNNDEKIELARPAYPREGYRLEPPSMSGTFNATTAEAEEENREALEDDDTPPILSHHEDTSAPQTPSPSMSPASSVPVPAPSVPTPPPPMPQSIVPPVPTPLPSLAPPESNPAPTAPAPEDTGEQHELDLDAARQAVTDALSGTDFDTAAPAASAPTTPAPSAAPPAAPAPMPAPADSSSGIPPLPDFSTLPPLPPLPPAPSGMDSSMPPAIGPATPGLPSIQNQPSPPSPGQVSSDPNDPSQFHVPGQ
jgi:hypothetical protein